MSDQITVSDIFRRALEMRAGNPSGSYKDVTKQIVSEFSGRAFPSADKLTIPEYDNIAPQEDWTAGLPVVLRGNGREGETATLLSRCLFTLTLRVGGFAPRQFRRYASAPSLLS